jgi:hypothetical protein
MTYCRLTKTEELAYWRLMLATTNLATGRHGEMVSQRQDEKVISIFVVLLLATSQRAKV